MSLYQEAETVAPAPKETLFVFKTGNQAASPAPGSADKIPVQSRKNANTARSAQLSLSNDWLSLVPQVCSNRWVERVGLRSPDLFVGGYLWTSTAHMSHEHAHIGLGILPQLDRR